jgi:hypothetical protein
VDIVRLAGFSASYTLTVPGPAEDATWMVVTNHLTAKRAIYDGPVEVRAEVLTPSGTVAWAGRNKDDLASGNFSVRALNASGSILLDRSPGIDPTALRLSGSTLTWLDGGAQSSAML